MTETSLVPMTIEAAGLHPGAVYRQLLEKVLTERISPAQA
jgi:hypothetical protein